MASNDGWVDAPTDADDWEDAPADVPQDIEPTEPDLISSALDAVAKPFQMIGRALEEADKITNAPVRAGVDRLQKGQGFEKAVAAAGEQFVEGFPSKGPEGLSPGKLLPTTPRMSEIFSRDMQQRGIPKQFADIAGGMGGFVGEVATDPLQLIPGETATGVARGISRGIGGALKGVAGAAGAVERGIAKPIFGVGHAMTQRNIPYDKALKAAQTLKSYELMVPGNEYFGFSAGAKKALGKARQELRTAEKTVPGSHAVAQGIVDEMKTMAQPTMDMAGRMKPPLLPNAQHGIVNDTVQYIENRMYETVTQEIPKEELLATLDGMKTQFAEMASSSKPLSDARKQLINDLLKSGRFDPDLRDGGREVLAALAAENPQLARQWDDAEKMRREASIQIGRVEEMLRWTNPPATRQVRMPRDLSIDEIDDIIDVSLDPQRFTGLGNERASKVRWTPMVAKARKTFNDSLKSIPEGLLFTERKDRSSALMTASHGRSRLIEALGTATGAGGVGMAFVDPAALAATVAGLSLKPGTYYRLMGVMKIPGDIARALDASYQTGKIGIIRDSLANFAEKHPLLAERFVRGIVLASGKPAANQDLTPKELATLSKPRSFEAEDIAEEIDRIRSSDMPSVEKASRLNAIAKNGYVEDDAPAVEYSNEMPMKPRVDPEEFKRVLKSIQGG